MGNDLPYDLRDNQCHQRIGLPLCHEQYSEHSTWIFTPVQSTNRKTEERKQLGHE